MAQVYERPNSRFFWIRYWDGSQEIRESSKTANRREAERLLRQRLEDVERLRHSSRMTFKEAVVRFFDEAGLKPKTLKGYQSSFRNLDPLVGNLMLEQIDTTVLKTYVSNRKAGTTGDTAIRRDLAFLSSLFTYATNWPGGPATNPVIAWSGKKKLLEPDAKRKRWLTREEYSTLLSCCSQTQHCDILTLAVETGMRRGELERLDWDRNVKLQKRVIILLDDDTKTDTARTVPLSKEAVRVLTGTLRHPDTTRVFWHGNGEPYSDFSNWWWFLQRRAEKAGVMDLRFHDLRRTFASWWLQDGGDWEILRKMLGHTQAEMTDRYGHLRTSDLSDEMDRLEQQRSVKDD